MAATITASTAGMTSSFVMIKFDENDRALGSDSRVTTRAASELVALDAVTPDSVLPQNLTINEATLLLARE